VTQRQNTIESLGRPILQLDAEENVLNRFNAATAIGGKSLTALRCGSVRKIQGLAKYEDKAEELA
jgi:hypothetical protein